MIEKWDIRENTVSDGSVYVLVLKGADADAAALQAGLAGFANLITARVPGFTHVLELSSITDDGMLERIRTRIEEIVRQTNGASEQAPAPAPQQPAPETPPAKPEPAPAPAAPKPAFVQPSAAKIIKPSMPPAPSAAKPAPALSQEDIFAPADKDILKPAPPPEPAPAEETVDIISLITGCEESSGSQKITAVQLANTDLSLRRPKDQSIRLNSIKLENDLEAGDGTLINLGAVDTKEIKDMSGYNQKAFESLRSDIRPLGPTPSQPVKEPEPAPAPKPAQMPLAPGIEKDPAPQPEEQTAAPTEKTAPRKEAPAQKSGGLFGRLFGKISSAKDAAKKEIAARKEDLLKKTAKEKPAPQQQATPAPVEPPQVEAASPAPAPAQPSVVKEVPAQPAPKPQDNKKDDGAKEANLNKSFSENPQQLAAEIFTQNDNLTGSMPVDDIFAAETILDFYSDVEIKPNKDKPVSQIIPTMPPAKKQLIGDDLLDVPANLLNTVPPTQAPKPAAQTQPAQPAPEPAPAAQPEQKVSLAPEPPAAKTVPAAQPAQPNPQTHKISLATEPPAAQTEPPQQADRPPVEGMVDLTERGAVLAPPQKQKPDAEPFDIHDITSGNSGMQVQEMAPPPAPVQKIKPPPPPRPAPPAPPPPPPPSARTETKVDILSQINTLSGQNLKKPARERTMTQDENTKNTNLPKEPKPTILPAPPKPAGTVMTAKAPAVAPAAPKISAAPAAKSAPKPPAVPAAPVERPASPPAASKYKRSNWPLEMPLVPTFTFDAMDMASNRFSHANAMSVLENLGTVYNPFFVFGEAGSGKTHFLHAMGYEISKKISQEKVFLTNGVRLARGIQRYVEEGKVSQLEDMAKAAQVLIIDDIHLTAVNEFNRELISRLLNEFLKAKKQIIISSKYPPESLTRFEDLVGFKLAQGWVSELKPPRPQHFARIYNKMVNQADLGLNEAQTKAFFGGDGITLGKIARDIRRVKVLRRRIEDSGSPEKTYEELLTEMLAPAGESDFSDIARKDIADITALPRMESTEWGNFGFFFPQDQADKFNWIAYAIMQKAEELGIKGGLHFGLKSAYSTENIISSAFKIANICDNKNLKGAIILGPSIAATLVPIRENFYDIVSHMLEVMMIRCGTIDAELIKNPSTYVKVLGDIIK